MRSASRAGSVAMAKRLRGRPLAAVVPIGIGHNNGPPMATRWDLHCWRRAQAKVWKSPPREVVQLRLRRAGELGLTYRQLTLLLMDVGRVPTAIVFAVAGTLIDGVAGDGRALRLLPGVADRLRVLTSPKVFLAAGAEGEGTIESLVAASGVRIAGWCAAPDAPGRAAALLDLLVVHAVSPRATIMIGTAPADRACADRAALAGFFDASPYFSPATPGPNP